MKYSNHLLIAISVIVGLILYQAMGPSASMLQTLAIAGFIMLPFFCINIRLSQKALVAGLLMTLPMNIDQVLFLHPEHVGGSLGLIISFNGICIVLLYMLHFIQRYRGEAQPLRFPSPTTSLFLALILAGILSMGHARVRALSLFEMLEVIKMFCIFLYIANYLRDRRHLSWVLSILVAGLAIEGIIAIGQYVTRSNLNLKILGAEPPPDVYFQADDGIYRVGGTLGGANSLAWYLDFMLPVCAALLLARIKLLFKLPICMSFALGLAALKITFSRGGWLGFFAGSVAVLVFHVVKLSPFYRLYVTMMLVLVLVLGFVLIAGVDNPIRERFLMDDDGSAYVRIPLMKVAINMIKASPFFGHGVNNYIYHHREFDNTSDQVTSHFPYPVHNLFLQTAAEIGLPGLFFFLSFVCVILFKAIRMVRREHGLTRITAMGVVGGIMAGMLQGLVENCSIGNYNLLSFWVMAGMVEGLNFKETTP